jgi:adenylosuccinate lyase
MLSLSSLTAISPIDGRYADKTAELRLLLSEYGLLRFRVKIEVRWLQALAKHPQIQEVPPFSASAQTYLYTLIENFSLQDAQTIKKIEATIHHDVKAVEYFIKEKLTHHTELAALKEFIHFACTSEDINNLAYALMLQTSRNEILIPQMQALIEQLALFAYQAAEQPLLARTHGQPATPTTVGKEFANIVYRLRQYYRQFKNIALAGKFNGAVGNYNAHVIAYPTINWITFSQQFVESFYLQWLPYTTQIAPHDDIADYCDTLKHFNNILITLARDCWGYIALGYFKQSLNSQEVGSSTMPHKINPINFENAEANLSLANSLLQHFSSQLLQTRWQRDLRDSSLLRNIGVAIAHSLLAWKNIQQGLSKLSLDTEQLNAALESHWEVLAEAIQTVLRRYNSELPYERLKTLTRGQRLDAQSLQAFIATLDIPEAARQQLSNLTPQTYLGYAVNLGKAILPQD